MNDKFISTTQAVTLAKEYGVLVSRQAIINWAKIYELGHQLGNARHGKWVVHKQRWIDFIHGKLPNGQKAVFIHGQAPTKRKRKETGSADSED